MNDSEFTEFIQSIREAGSYLRGQKGGVAKVDRIDPSGVASIRARLKVSQPQFATLGATRAPAYRCGACIVTGCCQTP
jgi:hypothetical protein